MRIDRFVSVRSVNVAKGETYSDREYLPVLYQGW